MLGGGGREEGNVRIYDRGLSLLLDQIVSYLYLNYRASDCGISCSEVNPKLVVAQWLSCLKEDNVRNVTKVRRGSFLPAVLRTHQGLFGALLDDSWIFSV